MAQFEDKISNFLFYDIETHRVKEFDEISPRLQKAFINHYYDENSYETPAEHYAEIAALHPEFSQVICISFGYEAPDGNFKVSHIVDLNEKELLSKFDQVLSQFQKMGFALAGHNIYGCDNPYLMKRYVINNMKVPSMINHIYEKPWEINDLDTMNLYKMGGWRTNTSLETICAALNIECKSEEISGANLWKYKIADVPLDELATYCDEDVVSCYRLAKHLYKYLW